jgi:UDP-N-acetylglucosamine:LPS N-acetylglucosamine transferase
VGVPGQSKWLSALILSGSIGMGHSSVASACEGALSSIGIATETVDCLNLLGVVNARLSQAVFKQMFAVQSLFDGYHFTHLRGGSKLAKRMEEASTKRILPKISTYLDKHPCELLISVFASGVPVAGRLKKEKRNLFTVTFCTDATAHSMWVQEGIDLYLVSSELAAATVRQYQPSATVRMLPAPVRKVFYDAPDSLTARQRLGIPNDVPCVLAMAGGWGVGPLAELSTALAATGVEVLAVAGSNGRLFNQLAALAARNDHIHAYGFTDKVPELMAASDLVLTSPGQSCTEARVVGRPLVLLDVVPGHGRENLLHELEMGGALASLADPATVTRAVHYCLDHPPAVDRWPVSTSEEWEKLFIDALVEHRA